MHFYPVMWKYKGRLVDMPDGQFDRWQHTLPDTGLQVPVRSREKAGYVNIVLLVPKIVFKMKYFILFSLPSMAAIYWLCVRMKALNKVVAKLSLAHQ